jgi:predicted MFS family arabinose efflux permease
LNGVSFVALIIPLWMMKPTSAALSAQSNQENAAAWFGGFDVVWRNPRLLGLMLVMAAVQLTGGAYVALLPAVAQNMLDLDAKGYSGLLLANGVGALLGSLAVASLTGLAVRRKSIVLGIVMMAGGLSALSICKSFAPAAGFLLIVGAGFVVFLASTNSTIQLSVADQVRGRVMSIWVLTFGAAQPLGSYIAGASAPWGGTPGVLFRGGVGCLICAAAAYYVLRMPAVEECLDKPISRLPPSPASS